MLLVERNTIYWIKIIDIINKSYLLLRYPPPLHNLSCVAIDFIKLDAEHKLQTLQKMKFSLFSALFSTVWIGLRRSFSSNLSTSSDLGIQIKKNG